MRVRWNFPSVGELHAEKVRPGIPLAPDNPRRLQRGIVRRAEPAKIRRQSGHWIHALRRREIRAKATRKQDNGHKAYHRREAQRENSGSIRVWRVLLGSCQKASPNALPESRYDEGAYSSLISSRVRTIKLRTPMIVPKGKPIQAMMDRMREAFLWTFLKRRTPLTA
jgi:hypothetical protein